MTTGERMTLLTGSRSRLYLLAGSGCRKGTHLTCGEQCGVMLILRRNLLVKINTVSAGGLLLQERHALDLRKGMASAVLGKY